MSLGSGIRDPGSGINLFRIPDPGVKKAPDPRSRIRNTAGRIKKNLFNPEKQVNNQELSTSKESTKSNVPNPEPDLNPPLDPQSTINKQKI